MCRAVLLGLTLAGALLGQTPKYAVGRAPTPEEIKAWDISIPPDGSGLPEGSGTAAQGKDLYASKWKAFLRVTLPLSLPGVVAGTLLTFIPAAGDFINAQLLGSTKQHMIGNVIQSKFLELTDYPAAAAMSFILMAIILVLVFIYARAVGTEKLTG